MPPLDDLLDDLFDGKKPAFYFEIAGWLRASRRFKAFATSHRGKIRTKLKNAHDDGSKKDVRAELETAWLLLREERFTLEYEKYAAAKQRGPDFTVIFKTHTPFNVEVRRLRTLELDDGDAEARASKLMAVLCDKVGQMPPSIPNVLWLITERALSEADLTHAVTKLRQLADSKTEDFFTRRGFENATDFLKQYSRLSAIVLHQSGEQVLWLNSIARHKTPPEIVTALQRLATLGMPK